ncbi:MAG: putative dynein heavy chain [Streblomastix strix]|uniref:Putative dynein heavy chain n=1 Tax=Streblomastix strix TaxID=222440 RepID=A0A5J4VUM8_9EUKA|nr:MAG: putative dynein heavy chain [Streblomastix strix]
MYFGETGVGKSVIAYDLFERTRQTKARLSVIINFSAQTSARRTQTMIESKILFKGDHNTTPLRQQVVLFIDDFNTQVLDTFGSQPPLELLRQMLYIGGLYDRTQLVFKNVKEVSIVAACGFFGCGRNKVSQRLTVQFIQLFDPQPNEKYLVRIFNSILMRYICALPFAGGMKEIAPLIVKTSVDLYQFSLAELIPISSYSHYVFNLRDLSKVFQGIMQYDIMFEKKVVKEGPFELEYRQAKDDKAKAGKKKQYDQSKQFPL